MAMTALSYFILTIPAIIEKGKSYHEQTKAEHYPALVGMIVCTILLVAYAIYQTQSSNAQVAQEMEQSKLKFLRWRAHIGKSFGNATIAMRAVFEKFDKDKNGTIDRSELAQGFAALGLQCSRQQIFEIMDSMNFDENVDTLTFEEFSKAFKQWSRILITNDTETSIALQMQLPGTVPSLPVTRSIDLYNPPIVDGINRNSNSNYNQYNDNCNDNNLNLNIKESQFQSRAQFGNQLEIPAVNRQNRMSSFASSECVSEREELLTCMYIKKQFIHIYYIICQLKLFMCGT